MFDKERFAQLLTIARGERSNQEYADDSGVSRSYISMYINQKREDPPSPDILKKLAKAAHNGVNYAQLMAAAGYVWWVDKEAGEVYEIDAFTDKGLVKAIHGSGVILEDNLKFYNAPDGFLPLPVQQIPVLGSIPAGVPIEAVEDIIGYEEIPADWLKGGREYFALRIKGDSMYPDYQDGDIVIVRKQSTCDSGDDCVVIINETDATLKRVHKLPDGIELEAINRMYGRRKYTYDEIKSIPIAILGVVVELRRKKK